MSDASGFVTPPPAEEPTHNPCCSSHNVPMGCVQYRRTHFVEVGACCSAWKAEHGDTPPPFTAGPTIDEHLAKLAEFRAKAEGAGEAVVYLGDRLADHVVRKLDGGDRERAGLTIVQVGAAASVLVHHGMSAAAVINILLLAGEKLVADARTESEAARG